MASSTQYKIWVTDRWDYMRKRRSFKLMYSSNRKWIILFLAVTLVPPIIINGLFLLKVPFIPVAQDNNWIGFFGSYLGSIIGGALTLIGVRLSITSQEKRKFIDEVPTKIRRIDKLLNQINNLLNNLMTKNDNNKTYLNFNKERVEELVDRIMEEASKTDGETYNNSYSLHLTIKFYFELNWENVELDDWGQLIVKEGKAIDFIDKLMELHDSINIHVENFRNHRNDLSNKYFRLVNNL